VRGHVASKRVLQLCGVSLSPGGRRVRELARGGQGSFRMVSKARTGSGRALETDRKSTRLNSSHSQISYAVFCLKKKKKTDARMSYFNFRHKKQIWRSRLMFCIPLRLLFELEIPEFPCNFYSD